MTFYLLHALLEKPNTPKNRCGSLHRGPSQKSSCIFESTWEKLEYHASMHLQQILANSSFSVIWAYASFSVANYLHLQGIVDKAKCITVRTGSNTSIWAFSQRSWGNALLRETLQGVQDRRWSIFPSGPGKNLAFNVVSTAKISKSIFCPLSL